MLRSGSPLTTGASTRTSPNKESSVCGDLRAANRRAVARGYHVHQPPRSNGLRGRGRIQVRLGCPLGRAPGSRLWAGEDLSNARFL